MASVDSPHNATSSPTLGRIRDGATVQGSGNAWGRLEKRNKMRLSNGRLEGWRSWSSPELAASPVTLMRSALVRTLVLFGTRCGDET
jgi:hypothetical protein